MSITQDCSPHQMTHPKTLLSEHHGLCRALSYIMQSLSAEKRFGQQMQSPMPMRIPIPQKWVAVGTAADFFVSVCVPYPHQYSDYHSTDNHDANHSIL